MDNRLKEFRVQLHLTLAELAGRSDVPISTINSIEHGAEPKFSTAIRLAYALRTPAIKIFPVELPDNSNFYGLS